MKMLKLIITLFVSLLFFTTKGQELEVLHGMEMFYIKVEEGHSEEARNSINNHNNHWKVRYTHYPFILNNIGVLASYHTVSPLASVLIGTDAEVSLSGKEEALFLSGSPGKTKVHRFGIGLNFKTKLLNNRLLLNSRFVVNNEFSMQTKDPAYHFMGKIGAYDYWYYSYSNPGFQMVPELSLGVQLKIYKWINLNLDYSYLQGFRPFLYSKVDYKIDNSEKASATFYNDGTAHHIMLGISIDLIERE